jgi:multiple sugar transport system substrate-binding protein
MSGKFALIIGNTEYIDPGLAQLTAPGKDAEDFARVLQDKEICAFDEVRVLLNHVSSTVIEAVDEFFDQKKPDDLLVLYFSGHGVRDELGALYLAVKNTIRSRLRSTAIKSDYIRDAMNQSRSKRQVVVLDCCNSGAFSQGMKAETGGPMGMVSAFQGYGRYVLTASDEIQFAWEGDKIIGETDNSLFTHFLLKGLEGEADSDSDGRITVDELYDYAYEQISRLTPKQTPRKDASKQEGEIILRQNMRIEDIKPVPLSAELIDEIEDLRPYVREIAVQKLEKILKGKNIGLARSARDALEKIAADENTTRRVSQAATQILESIRQAEQLAILKAEEERKAREEAERIAILKAEEERIERERVDEERKAREELERRVREKVEAEWKAQEEAKRLAAQKAEEERITKAKIEVERLAEEKRLATEKAQAERKAKEERLALEKAEAKRLAALKSEEERKAREEAERLTAQKAEAQRRATPAQSLPTAMKAATVSAVPQKKPISRGSVIGIVAGVAVVGCVIAALAINAILNRVPPAATEPPRTELPATTEAPAQPAASSEKVQIRWFVGLGVGTDETMIGTQNEVVSDFNASQNKIELVLEIVDYNTARDTLATQIASGNSPDIVGPVGWGGANAFYGEWLDLTPYIEETGFDTSIFNSALIRYYQTEEGQVALPFAVFPGAIYFVPTMFDEAGLNYPPQNYGEGYVMPDSTQVDWDWNTLTEIAKLLTVDANGNNSTEAGFDPSQIVQVGYSPQWQSIISVGTFFDGAAKIYTGNQKGSFESAIPDGWMESFLWYYEGMWGEQPFIATGPLSADPNFGNGNIFNSGRAAMALTQSWYTCCLADFRAAGNEFQLGVQPMGFDGVVHGRIDADTFRILKGTPHPNEAFEVLTYLITIGADKLLPVYGAMPAIASKTDTYLETKANEYPFVTPQSWNVFVQGLAYPDTPSSEQYQPNAVDANARFATFLDLLNNNPGLNFDTEFQRLVDDLNAIYNQ